MVQRGASSLMKAQASITDVRVPSVKINGIGDAMLTLFGNEAQQEPVIVMDRDEVKKVIAAIGASAVVDSKLKQRTYLYILQETKAYGDEKALIYDIGKGLDETVVKQFHQRYRTWKNRNIIDGRLMTKQEKERIRREREQREEEVMRSTGVLSVKGTAVQIILFALDCLKSREEFMQVHDKVKGLAIFYEVKENNKKERTLENQTYHGFGTATVAPSVLTNREERRRISRSKAR